MTLSFGTLGLLGPEVTMPSKTPKQARTMRAAANDAQIAKRLGIPPKTAREFVKADQKEDAAKNRKRK